MNDTTYSTVTVNKEFIARNSAEGQMLYDESRMYVSKNADWNVNLRYVDKLLVKGKFVMSKLRNHVQLCTKDDVWEVKGNIVPVFH